MVVVVVLVVAIVVVLAVLVALVVVTRDSVINKLKVAVEDMSTITSIPLSDLENCQNPTQP